MFPILRRVKAGIREKSPDPQEKYEEAVKITGSDNFGGEE